MASKKDSLEALKQEVEASPQGVVLTTGERLRIAAGITRLKEKARGEVANSLEGALLVAVPGVPRYQHEEVYVATLGSETGLLHLALEAPSKQNLKVIETAAGRVADSPLYRPILLDEIGEALAEAGDTLTELRTELEAD